MFIFIGDESNSDSDAGDDTPSRPTSTTGATSKRKMDQSDTSSGSRMKKRTTLPQWIDVPEDSSEKPVPSEMQLSEEHILGSPIDYFRQFFDSDLLDIIVRESNIYSVQKNPNKPLNISKTELEQFIGTCIYMSVYGLPRSRMCWNNSTRIGAIADVMSRNRWEEIKNNLHFNNNDNMPRPNDPEKDRLFKIRPLIDSLQTTFKKIPIEESMICVDEQIVPFKGKSALKQYNPKNPINGAIRFLFSVTKMV